MKNQAKSAWWAFWSGLGLLQLLLLPALNASYAAPQPVYLMGAMGDSITAATFADYALPQAWQYDWMQPEDLDQERLLIDAMLENKATLSWASGSKIKSQYLLLKEYLKSRGQGGLHVLNVSVPGDKAIHMQGQAAKIVREMATGKYAALKYVTFFIGANDACAGSSGTPDADMRAQLHRAFAELSKIRQAEPIRILMVGLPQIADLGLPEIRNHSTILGMRCERLRNDILNLCNGLTAWDSPAQFAHARAVVVSKNALLGQVAREAQQKFPALQISFTQALHAFHIAPAIMAVDCFHPNAKGQEMISSELWREQPWFKAATPEALVHPED